MLGLAILGLQLTLITAIFGIRGLQKSWRKLVGKKKGKKNKRRARLEEQTASSRSSRGEKKRVLTRRRRKVSRRELPTAQASRRSASSLPRTPVVGDRSLPLGSPERPNKELQAPLESRALTDTVALARACEPCSPGSLLWSSSSRDSSTRELLVTSQPEQVPRYWVQARAQSPMDVQMSPSSPPAVASTTRKGIPASYGALRAARTWTKPMTKQLEVDVAKSQGTLGAPRGILPGGPSFPPSRMEGRRYQEVQQDRLQPQGPSPKRPRSRRLREGCARLWRCLKAWGRRLCCCLPPAVEQ